MEQVDELRAVDAERLRGAVQIEAVTGLVLHLGHEDRLAAEGGRAGDPVALGLHPDDLGVGVLGNLADERRAVTLGHPVARLDPLIGVDQPLELHLEGVGDDLRHVCPAASSHIPFYGGVLSRTVLDGVGAQGRQ